MTNLGKKHDCAECGAKFYDLGKSAAICPKCGTDQVAHAKAKAKAVAEAEAAVLAGIEESTTEDHTEDLSEEDHGLIDDEDEVVPEEDEGED